LREELFSFEEAFEYSGPFCADDGSFFCPVIGILVTELS